MAATFMEMNGYDLVYVESEENGNSAFANIIEKCAAGEASKEEWFETHKVDGEVLG